MQRKFKIGSKVKWSAITGVTFRGQLVGKVLGYHGNHDLIVSLLTPDAIDGSIAKVYHCSALEPDETN